MLLVARCHEFGSGPFAALIEALDLATAPPEIPGLDKHSGNLWEYDSAVGGQDTGPITAMAPATSPGIAEF